VHYLVRFERLAEACFAKTLVRAVEDRCLDDHGTLCRAFSLDPVRTRFDLPTTWRNGGSGSGACSGIVYFAGEDKPIGKITIMRDRERVRDVDPLNARDFYNLGA
jgi:hypothetical protein